MNFIPQLWILLDIVIAVVLGGILGYEREVKDKPAGFRTNMLIAGASALLLSLGRIVVNEMEVDIADKALGVDPTRIIHAIIVGVSFIGAGTILKSRDENTIRYLTTAATILLSSSVGMAVALNQYLLAVGVTLLGVIINAAVRKIGKMI
jgi:putative Mg2+ transporter-C (MgtC) family protein